MHLHYPALVLVPDTFLPPKDSLGPSSKNKTNSTSLLVQRLCDEFPGVPVEPVLRKFWNEDAGTGRCSLCQLFSHGLNEASNLCLSFAFRTKNAQP
jgi:hypothetical protein